MSAVTALRWVEIDESDARDEHKATVCVGRPYYGVTGYFKLQAQILTPAGLAWVDVPIDWNPQ